MEEDNKVLEVVAALIRRGDTFLICQRPANKARGLLWEFVGGKVEKGETKEQALIRECCEELQIEVTPQDVFAQVTHVYPDVTVHLTLFNTIIKSGEPRLTEHADMRWVTPLQAQSYPFCPADIAILKLIVRNSLLNRT